MHPEFEFHRLNEAGMAAAKRIAQQFDSLLAGFEKQFPGKVIRTREFEIAKNKLEEACFYAKKAVAVNKDYQNTGD